MKKFIVGVLGVMMLVSVGAQAGVSSSRSSLSSSSRSSYSAPKTYAAPKAASTSSNPGLKALGFSRPASSPTVSNKPSVSPSPSRVAAPVAKTTSTSGGWFSKKTVSSAPATAYRAPVRQVSSPVAYRSGSTYRSQPVQHTTVIQRNYYGNSYGGGYGYGGYGYHSPYYGYSSGFGSSFAGTLGGMMMYNALFNNHSTTTSSGATAAQIEQAKTDQRIEDKLDRVIDQQNQPQGVTPMVASQAQPQALQPVQKPQCFLPQDAPLMMNPSFYCQQ